MAANRLPGNIVDISAIHKLEALLHGEMICVCGSFLVEEAWRGEIDVGVGRSVELSAKLRAWYLLVPWVPMTLPTISEAYPAIVDGEQTKKELQT